MQNTSDKKVLQNYFSKINGFNRNEYKKELKKYEYFNSLFKTNRKAPISTPTALNSSGGFMSNLMSQL